MNAFGLNAVYKNSVWDGVPEISKNAVWDGVLCCEFEVSHG